MQVALIYPGDLIHGDVNGFTVIPPAIAGQVAAAAARIRAEEAALREYIHAQIESTQAIDEIDRIVTLRVWTSRGLGRRT